MSEIVEVPYQCLEKETLSALIEAFVLREGTDYGEMEWSLEDKKDQVLLQLTRGEVVIIFDEATESCTLLHKEQLG